MEKFRHFKDDREDGFSLVELLVVIVIIGILSAIAIGAFLNQRKKANDAALKSDLRTVANAYTTWSMDNSIEELKSIAGNSHSTWVYGDGIEKDTPRNYWNNHEELPKLNISDGNKVEIVVIQRNDRNDNWNRKFDEGEFCLIGIGENTSWNYGMEEGISGMENYDKLLFWDSKIGGLKTMDELVGAHENGQELSCSGHALGYIAATGS